MHGRPILLDIAPDPATYAKTSVHRVILYEDTWNTHIIVSHPELRQSSLKVEEILRSPTDIFRSTSVVGSLLYVKFGVDDGNGRLLRVVVRPMPGFNAFVPTAYFSSANGGSLL